MVPCLLHSPALILHSSRREIKEPLESGSATQVMHLGWVMPCQLHPSGNSLMWWPGLERWCQTVVRGLGVTELTGAENVMKGDGGE